jgi:hypothetical protein
MSTPTADSPAFSAAEFVKGLTNEQKDEVLFAIVREFLAVEPESDVIPLHPEGGELLGHLLTTRGSKRLLDGDGWRYLPELLIPVVHSDADRPKGIPAAELWARIDAEEAAQAARSESRAAG